MYQKRPKSSLEVGEIENSMMESVHQDISSMTNQGEVGTWGREGVSCPRRGVGTGILVFGLAHIFANGHFEARWAIGSSTCVLIISSRSATRLESRPHTQLVNNKQGEKNSEGKREQKPNVKNVPPIKMAKPIHNNGTLGQN